MARRAPHPRSSSPPPFLGIPGCDRLALRALQYEFPAHTSPGDYDSNWLRIQGWVERVDGRWKFNDPCLLTHELAELIEWLRALPSPPSDSIDFLEPLLAFSTSEHDEWTIRVQLRAEAVPESVGGEQRWREGVTLELVTTPEQRDRIVAELEADLAKYPPR